MTRHRQMLPQLDGPLFLTDGGIETTLIFHKGIELPEFATFVLLDNVFGGCCGTDHRHVGNVLQALYV